MADLTDKQAAQSVKITGADPSTGIEDNFAEIDSLGNIQTLVNNASGASAVNIQDGGNSITIDATSLPLPTGAATSALQTTANTSLANIDAGIPAALGQTTMTASMPVVIASDQSAVAISAASLPLPTGAATAANQTTEITSLQLLDNVIGPVTPGTVATGSTLIGAQYNTSAPSPSNGQQVALQVDSQGRLIISPVQASALPPTGSQFSFGQLNTSTSAAYLAVEFTAYTEPTTNSAMTIVSANANDTSAGTGARTVIVTYLDQIGAGPFTTTFTMNGTTPVTAGVSNMCFIEKIVVATVGSTGSNVGILTLKTGGAATVGTIGATANQTLWAHHYVPTGKTSYISGFSFGNNSTATGNGAQFILKASTPTISNTPEIQVSDFLDLAGATSTITRVYNSPIQVVGPARVRAYVLPFANAATTQFAAFDFIDN